MLAYQNGSDEAFTVLYRRHSARVYGFLFSRLRDRALTDDIFQATFLKLHRFRGKYDAAAPFLPWLFVVCRTEMIQRIRARNRVQARETPAAEAEDSLLNAEAPAPAEPEASVNLEGLPPQQRRALELRFGEDLSFDEIAERLHLTPENSRQLVSRAVRRLRKLARGGIS